MPGEPRTLLFIPQSWPFPDAAEDTFISPEIPHLLDAFDTVVVAPLQGDPLSAPAMQHPRLHIETSLLGSLDAPPAWQATLARILQPAAVDAGTGLRARIVRARRAALAMDIAARLRPLVERVRPTLAYTYWFHAATQAACHLGLRCATRAHGYDLYEERGPDGFQPWRRALLQRIALVATVSEHGRAHLQRNHGDNGRIETHRLGVASDGPMAGWDADRITLVSCSAAIPLKRLERIHAVAAALAADRPVRWLHLGDGPSMQKLRTATSRHGLTCDYPGQVAADTVRQRLRAARPLLFINQSETEGVPVGVMEALSCGIPVCAGTVGGIPEVVDQSCGILHAPDAEPAAVARAIATIADDAERRQRMGEQALMAWARHCDPATNHARFASRLRSLSP